MIVDGDPNLGSTGEGRHSRDKCLQAFLRAEMHVFAGPRVVAANQSRCFRWIVDGL